VRFYQLKTNELSDLEGYSGGWNAECTRDGIEMGLFFEAPLIRGSLVEVEKSTRIAVSKPLGFLVDPNNNERALRL
jgi:hypothetical protein